jgi:hypothetical protein
MVLYFLTGSKFGSSQIFKLNETDLGPFSWTNQTLLKNLMREVDSFEVRFQLRNILPEIALSEASCYDWTIK